MLVGPFDAYVAMSVDSKGNYGSFRSMTRQDNKQFKLLLPCSVCVVTVPLLCEQGGGRERRESASRLHPCL